MLLSLKTFFFTPTPLISAAHAGDPSTPADAGTTTHCLGGNPHDPHPGHTPPFEHALIGSNPGGGDKEATTAVSDEANAGGRLRISVYVFVCVWQLCVCVAGCVCVWQLCFICVRLCVCGRLCFICVRVCVCGRLCCRDSAEMGGSSILLGGEVLGYCVPSPCISCNVFRDCWPGASHLNNWSGIMLEIFSHVNVDP